MDLAYLRKIKEKNSKNFKKPVLKYSTKKLISLVLTYHMYILGFEMPSMLPKFNFGIL